MNPGGRPCLERISSQPSLESTTFSRTPLAMLATSAESSLGSLKTWVGRTVWNVPRRRGAGVSDGRDEAITGGSVAIAVSLAAGVELGESLPWKWALMPVIAIAMIALATIAPKRQFLRIDLGANRLRPIGLPKLAPGSMGLSFVGLVAPITSDDTTAAIFLAL